MLDLQRVNQRLESQSSIPSLPSLSFNRINSTLSSIGARLERGDVWGDGGSEIDTGDHHQNDVIGEVDPDPDMQNALPLSSAQSSTELGSTNRTAINTASMEHAELSAQDQL